VISDITAQKRAEEGAGAFGKMARQASLLDAVMESLPVGLALLDAEGATMRENPEFERIWGRPWPGETRVIDPAVYRGWWTASGQPVRLEEWGSARALHRGETTVGQELVIQRFDGKRAFVLNSAAPFAMRMAGSPAARWR
jgi:PAS domain-containing protein